MSNVIKNYLKAYDDEEKRKYVHKQNDVTKRWEPDINGDFIFRAGNGIFRSEKHNNMLKLFSILEGSGCQIESLHRSDPRNGNVVLRADVSIEFKKPISLNVIGNVVAELNGCAQIEHMLKSGKRWGFKVKDDNDVQLD